MEHLIDSTNVRRNPNEAIRLAGQLEPENFHFLYRGNGEVQSMLYPPIDYRRDSLLEIHKRLRIRKEFASDEPQ
jgi:hypothetical protein